MMDGAAIQFVARAIAATLSDFAWQAALIGTAHEVVGRIFHRMAPRRRYALAIGALVVMAASAVLTLADQLNARSTGSLLSLGSLLPDRSGPGGIQWAPAIVSALWATGACTMAAWNLLGLWKIGRLATDAQQPPAWLTTRFERLKTQMRAGRVALFLHTGIDGPMMAGLFRSAIYLPLSAVTSLAPDQLDAVLAHELGHVIRADYHWNLFQRAMETLFFFHPFVWRVSRAAREQRELCCDDIAVSACPDAMVYAAALFALEQRRRGAAFGRNAFAMAAVGQAPSTLYRVQRLLETPSPARNAVGLTMLLLAVPAVLLCILGSSSLPARPIQSGPSPRTHHAAVPMPFANLGKTTGPKSHMSRSSHARPKRDTGAAWRTDRERTVPLAEQAANRQQAAANEKRIQNPVSPAQWARDQANARSP